MLSHSTLVQSAYQLQPLPPSMGRLTALMAEDPPDLDALTETIAYDPVITVKLLRVANSSFSAPSRSITHARDAILRMGPGIVFSLAIGSCARPLMEQTIPGYSMTAGALWAHSVRSALAAETAARFCTVRLPPASFTAALLHDIGKLVLGRFLTPERKEILRRAIREGHLTEFEAESETLSLHHGEVGGVVAQHWQLPETIVQGIIHHHDPDSSADVISHVTYLANQVAHYLEGTASEDAHDALRLSRSCEVLGLKEEKFETLCERTAECFEQMNTRFQ